MGTNHARDEHDEHDEEDLDDEDDGDEDEEDLDDEDDGDEDEEDLDDEDDGDEDEEDAQTVTPPVVAPVAVPVPPPSAPKAKPRAAKREQSRPVPGIGLVPHIATHFRVLRYRGPGQRGEPMRLDDDALGVQAVEWPISELSPAFIRQFGPGSYKAAFVRVELGDKPRRQAVGWTSQIIVPEPKPAPKEEPPPPMASDPAGQIADMFTRAMSSITKQVESNYERVLRQQDEMHRREREAEERRYQNGMAQQAEFFKATMGIMQQSHAQTVEALSSAKKDPISPEVMKLQLQLARARAERRRDDDDDDDDDDEDSGDAWVDLVRELGPQIGPEIGKKIVEAVLGGSPSPQRSAPAPAPAADPEPQDDDG